MFLLENSNLNYTENNAVVTKSIETKNLMLVMDLPKSWKALILPLRD